MNSQSTTLPKWELFAGTARQPQNAIRDENQTIIVSDVTDNHLARKLYQSREMYEVMKAFLQSHIQGKPTQEAIQAMEAIIRYIDS